MRLTYTPLPFSGGDVGARIRNLRRKKAPLWLTIIAAALCTLLAGCLLADQSMPAEEPSNSLDANRSFSVQNSIACATEDTVYYAVRDKGPKYYYTMLYYLDKATGITGPLCGKPECGHNDSDCNAYFSLGIIGLSVYDGKLYWLEEEYGAKEGGYGFSVKSMDLDGTNRRAVKALGMNLPSSYYDFAAYIHRNYVYLSYQPNVIENGGEVVRNYVCAFSLDTDVDGEIKILDEDGSRIFKVQPYGDSVYIMTGDDGLGITIRRWDVKTGTMETLFDGEVTFYWSRDFWVTDDGIFVDGCVKTGIDGNGDNMWQDGAYRYDFAGGNFELVFPLLEGQYRNTVILNNEYISIASATSAGENSRILIKDMNGQTVLDTDFSTIKLAQSLWNASILGADETNLYIYSSSKHSAFYAVPLDGSEARIVWSSEK